MALNTGAYAGKRITEKSQDSFKKASTHTGGDKKKVRPAQEFSGTVPGKSFLDTLKKACISRPDLYPPAIRDKCTSLPKLDRAAYEAAIVAGNCILCQEKHRYRQCPLLKGSGPATVLAKHLLKEYHAVKDRESKIG